MRKIRLGNRWVGDGALCFIIAEAGSNHNGSMIQAQKLIDVAASARADAVKFQLFRAEKLYPRNAGRSDYLKTRKPIYDIIKEMELPYEWLPKLAAHCRRKRILFLASVFDEESADRLDPYVQAHKIASYEMTHLPLIRHVAGKRKPVIISTGTANLDEVAQTVAAFRKTGNRNLLLMQCTAAYPAPLESLNVRAVAALKSAFGFPTGLSDHSRDPWLGPVAAVAAGANLIEKHFTLDNHLPGPDHAFAVEPDELAEMVRRIRQTEQVLGSGVKRMQPTEKELRDFGRRSIFAVQPIRAGESIMERHVATLRNGKNRAGIPPGCWDQVLGRKASRDIRPERPLRTADFA